MKYLFFFMFILNGFYSIAQKTEQKFNCEEMPTHFTVADKAIEIIKNSKFQHEESFEALAVRGIRKASFHSCDNETGFLLIEMHDRVVLHKEVPLKIWEEFKFSSALETYYRQNIKYKYIPL